MLQQQQQQKQHEREDARRPSPGNSSHQSPPAASSGVPNAMNTSVNGSASGPSTGRSGPPGAKGAGSGARATGEERRGGGGGGSRGGAADATDERVEVKGGSSVAHCKPGGGNVRIWGISLARRWVSGSGVEGSDRRSRAGRMLRFSLVQCCTDHELPFTRMEKTCSHVEADTRGELARVGYT